MNIKITRYQRSGQSIDGHLTIDEGLRLCDTAENRSSALSEGVYPIRIVKCKQYCRKMICLTPEPPCQQCDKIAEVSGNTTMPCHCPMLKPGNGIHNRNDGSIILGTYIAPGCLSHPKQAFDALYERIRKSAARGHELTIEIEETYPPEKRPSTLYEACEDWLHRVDSSSNVTLVPVTR